MLRERDAVEEMSWREVPWREVPWRRSRGGGAVGRCRGGGVLERGGVGEDMEKRSGGCWRGKIDKMREK